MNFSRESLEKTFKEALPILQEHWEEIAHYKDIPLEPDYEKYLQIESLGILRIFIARDDSGKMIGYAVYLVQKNMHYSSSLQAVQDILYIKKENRGTGVKFIKWCDEQLAKENVQIVYHHIKKNHNWGPMAERLGYELVDLIYSKRLDKKEE